MIKYFKDSLQTAYKPMKPSNCVELMHAHTHYIWTHTHTQVYKDLPYLKLYAFSIDVKYLHLKVNSCNNRKVLHFPIFLYVSYLHHMRTKGNCSQLSNSIH